MESDAKASVTVEVPAPWRTLVSRGMILTVWLPIVAVGAAHYGTAAGHSWAHDVLRRLYYLPIVAAAFQTGLRGGLGAALLVSLTYLPHAFLPHALHHFMHEDPADGIEKILEILLYNTVGAVAGYLADLERRRRVELQRALAEQQRLQTQLVRAGRLSALGEVVAGIAHELRNPLHALAGTAEIVDAVVPKDADERAMWEIHRSEIERLGRVAERFLSFARPRPLEVVPLDLREVAGRLVELVGADARKKGVTLEVALPDEPVPVRGDRDQLAQVALNIALNGFKAIGDSGGRMCVSVTSSGRGGSRTGVLRIENDGPPLGDVDREHLFDPFHSGNDEGTGLGLSISARIADQHGGYIEAANGGLGVVFTLVLPESGPDGALAESHGPGGSSP